MARKGIYVKKGSIFGVFTKKGKPMISKGKRVVVRMTDNGFVLLKAKKR